MNHNQNSFRSKVQNYISIMSNMYTACTIRMVKSLNWNDFNLDLYHLSNICMLGTQKFDIYFLKKIFTTE